MPNPNEPDKTKEAVNPEVEQLRKQLEEERKIREQVLSNPQMKMALQAIRDGKELTVKEKEALEEKKPVSMKDRFSKKDAPIDPDKLNEMSMSEAIGTLSDVIEDYIEQRLKESIEQVARPLDDRFKQLQANQDNLSKALIEQAKRTGATIMQKTYQDFDAYQEEAFKAVEQYGMSLEDAYVFVKAKKSANIPPKDELDTERPSIIPSRGGFESSREERTGEHHKRAAMSSRRLRSLTADAVQNVLSRRRSQQ